MAEVTVRQFADVVGVPVERLLAQLGDAGLPIKDADETITDKEKLRLLRYLRESHGAETVQASGEPRKVTLKRKTVSEIKVAGGPGKAKTVSVEVRRRRTYVKRGAAAGQGSTISTTAPVAGRWTLRSSRA